MLVISHVFGHFDIFSGEGFNTRSLLKLTKTPEGGHNLKYISGQRLPKPVMDKLKEKLDPKVHRQNIEE